MAQRHAKEALRAEDKYPATVRISRQHYLDMLAVWRHCRQITELKPAALRLEKLARELREELDKTGAPPLDDELIDTTRRQR